MITNLFIRVAPQGGLVYLVALAVFPAVIAIGTAQAAPQNEGQTVTVVATGVGKTADAAKHDALSNAVQQAVGMFVHGETIVANEQLIYDKVLTYSNALVASHDIMSAARKRKSDDLFEVTVRAVVLKSKVCERLQEAKVIAVPVSGKSILADMAVNAKNGEEGGEIIKRHLKSISTRLMIARLVNEQGKVVAPNIKPFIKKLENGRILCVWNIEIYFHLQAYYDQVAPALNKLLRSMAKKATSDTILSTTERMKELSWYNPTAVTGYPKLWKERSNADAEALATFVGTIGKDEFLVTLSMGRDRFSENERVASFILPQQGLLEAFNEIIQQPILKIAITADGDRLITDRSFPVHRTLIVEREENNRDFKQPINARWWGLDSHGIFFPDEIVRHDGSKAVLIAVRPMFELSNGDGTQTQWLRCDTALLRVEIELDEQDFAAMKAVRLSFDEQPLPKDDR